MSNNVTAGKHNSSIVYRKLWLGFSQIQALNVTENFINSSCITVSKNLYLLELKIYFTILKDKIL